MLTTFCKLRLFVLTALLSILAGTTALNAQTVKPVQKLPRPVAKEPSYVFTLESFQILDTRARHEDTDHVSFAIKVGDKSYPAKVRHMGDLNNGTYRTRLSFGPIVVPTPETKIVMTYLIMNSGHNEDKVSNWMQKGAEKLLDTGAEAVPGFGAIVKFIGNAGLGVLFPDCDGWVAGDQIKLTGKTLASYGETHRETRDYRGYDSPTGCGGNSHYKVTWSVTLKK